MYMQEVYTAFGKPHFSEGFFGVRQWDYIFKFKVGNKIEVCQYQVRYADNFTLSNTFWNRPECADHALFQTKALAAEPVVTEKVVERVVEKQILVNRVTLLSDALFDFGKSSINDILPGGKAQLALLAKSIKSDIQNVDKIQITGHTDRLGSDELNGLLSLARANTIRDVLMSHGISTISFKTVGMGSSKPVKTCSGTQAPSLIACLQDNRRVDIEVTGLAQTSVSKMVSLKPVDPVGQTETNKAVSWSPIFVRAE